MSGDFTFPVLEPPVAGTEAETLLGELERQRRLFAWKCSGLDAAGLQATLGPSVMTLGGLLKQMALVEDDHFARLLLADSPGEPWNTVDFESDPDWEWRTASGDSPEDMISEYARHLGHADLIRESVDGLVGEEPADGRS